MIDNRTTNETQSVVGDSRTMRPTLAPTRPYGTATCIGAE